MMPLRRFAIHQPKTVAEAAQMLGEFGEKGRLYAGGTELLLAMKHDLLRYEHLVDVKTIADLNKIEVKNGSLMIGSTATHRAIERSAIVKQSLPVLAEWKPTSPMCACARAALLGGNLCFAEPHSDPGNIAYRSRRQSPPSGKIRKQKRSHRISSSPAPTKPRSAVTIYWSASKSRCRQKPNAPLISNISSKNGRPSAWR